MWRTVVMLLTVRIKQNGGAEVRIQEIGDYARPNGFEDNAGKPMRRLAEGVDIGC